MKALKRELIILYMWMLSKLPGTVGCVLRAVALPSTIGRNAKIWDGVQIDYPARLKVGARASINRGAVLNCGGGITIGSDVLIGPNVTIYSQNHNYKSLQLISSQGYIRRATVIGDDVWLGANVTVLPGVEIAKGSVIGAGSVVTKSTEQYCVYVGNPARKIGRRGSE